MALRLYNTLTNTKEPFHPLRNRHVGIYACGITAYDICHLGHARSAVVFDTLARYLRYRGYDVTFVKNFTDVDDKIIRRAAAEGVSIGTVAERYILAHDTDMDSLGVGRPDIAPRATEHIGDMIRLIGALIGKGLAYVVDGDVYFRVTAFPSYGRLSGRNIEELAAGARVDVNERKQDPLDFALWKASKEGEPWWESPWGKGRPGWHIECSAMSGRFLGETFDIHGGGEDLIFPHHENEIAQSEGATGKPLARFWLHNGFVRIDREKMSKSLGNVFTIRELLTRYDAEVLRLFLLRHHYRSPVDFSDEGMEDARQGSLRLYGVLQGLKHLAGEARDGRDFVPPKVPAGQDAALEKRLATLPEQFVEAMDDDMNTAKVLGRLFEVVRMLNGWLSAKRKSTGAEISSFAGQAAQTLCTLGNVLGLCRVDPDEYFRRDRNRELDKRGMEPASVERRIAERSEAREAGDWKRADRIRDELAGMGVLIRDDPSGTDWRMA